MGILTAGAILATIESAGCRVGLRDGRLVVEGARGSVGGEMRAAIADQRAAVVALVSAVVASLPPDREGIRWATPEDFPRFRVSAFPRSERARWIADPRPDLADDGGRWVALLTMAYDWGGGEAAGLFAGLHYLRCGGAQLVAGSGGVRLVPGACPPDDYAAIRAAVLIPHRPRVAGWLAQLDRPIAEGA